MIKIKDESACSGCGACASVCPSGCITMGADEDGFLYPHVDETRCVKCGKCVRTCPISNLREEIQTERKPLAYAAKTTDEQVRENSSSGGIFAQIAAYVIRQGGVVFGAAFDERFFVKHIEVDSETQVEKLQGSKYVQSEIGQMFVSARRYLDEGRPVLFTGTPCQISGLYAFLGRNYDNLFTQDIICHGVPSPIVWKRYLEFRETSGASNVRQCAFRNKRFGWKKFSVQMKFENGAQYLKPLSDDLYMRSFLDNLCLRPSCYRCSFKTESRASDITLADFWGIEKVCPEMDDDKGTSLVIVHSEKGRRLFDELKVKLCYCEVAFEEGIKYNSAMTQSVAKNANRDAFVQCVSEKGFGAAAKKYLRRPLKLRIKQTVKLLLKKMIRR